MVWILVVWVCSGWRGVTDEPFTAGCHSQNHVSWPRWAFLPLAPAASSDCFEADSCYLHKRKKDPSSWTPLTQKHFSSYHKEIYILCVSAEDLFKSSTSDWFLIQFKIYRLWLIFTFPQRERILKLSLSVLLVIHCGWQVEVKNRLRLKVNPIQDLMLYSYRTWLMIFNRFCTLLAKSSYLGKEWLRSYNHWKERHLPAVAMLQ